MTDRRLIFVDCFFYGFFIRVDDFLKYRSSVTPNQTGRTSAVPDNARCALPRTRRSLDSMDFMLLDQGHDHRQCRPEPDAPAADSDPSHDAAAFDACP